MLDSSLSSLSRCIMIHFHFSLSLSLFKNSSHPDLHCGAFTLTCFLRRLFYFSTVYIVPFHTQKCSPFHCLAFKISFLFKMFDSSSLHLSLVFLFHFMLWRSFRVPFLFCFNQPALKSAPLHAQPHVLPCQASSMSAGYLVNLLHNLQTYIYVGKQKSLLHGSKLKATVPLN